MGLELTIAKIEILLNCFNKKVGYMDEELKANGFSVRCTKIE